MADNLHYNTVNPLLRRILNELMAAKELRAFRLVGGTALSLQRGHRESVDIDLFTDATYDTIDFGTIERFIRDNYNYVDTNNYEGPAGMGKAFYVGDSEEESVKLDIFYTDDFIRPATVIDHIRLATVEEIIAMKLDVISRVGRKKDFWDIHELMNDYSFDNMLDLHEERYSYTHDRARIKNNFGVFTTADEDFNPICLRNKYWELIKLDMIEFAGLELTD